MRPALFSHKKYTCHHRLLYPTGERFICYSMLLHNLQLLLIFKYDDMITCGEAISRIAHFKVLAAV